jgi:hypothetical protein
MSSIILGAIEKKVRRGFAAQKKELDKGNFLWYTFRGV